MPNADSGENDSPAALQEENLFQVLDAHLEAMHQGAAESADSSPRTESFAELPQLFRCLAGLERLAELATGAPPGVRAGFDSSNARGATESAWLKSLPRNLGPYVLTSEIGRGGMGIVFRARHRELGSDVAVKVIRSADWASNDQVRRFLREARAASRLRHPNIVTVYDVGEEDGLHYLAMHWVEGQNLAEFLSQHPLSPEEAIDLLIPVTRAVHYLHQQGLIHRDLKPANILIDAHHRPYVTDFGLAKVFDRDATGTSAGLIVGTPAYMSPEQAWGDENQLSQRSDVYSLGCILYEMLVGRPPFPEKHFLDLLLRLRDSEPLPPCTLRRSIPPDLELIALKCLEKQPQRRYASAEALAEDLDRFRTGVPLSVRPANWGRRVYRWSRSEPALASRVVAIGSMALIVQIAEWTSAGHRPQHLPIMSILVGWLIGSFVFQKLLNRDHTRNEIRYGWVLLDIGCFTGALASAERPMESLVIGYALMIVTSALWWRPAMIWTVTAASMIAFGGLVLLRGQPETPGHYPFIVVGVLGVIGAVMAGLMDYLLSLVKARTPH